MNVPNWWATILLALAAWRTFKLLAEDDILNGPRRYVTRLPESWKDGDTLPDEYRFRLAEFISCCYCLGFYCALAWWGAWQLWEHGALVAATPLALSALVIAAERLISGSD